MANQYYTDRNTIQYHGRVKHKIARRRSGTDNVRIRCTMEHDSGFLPCPGFGGRGRFRRGAPSGAFAQVNAACEAAHICQRRPDRRSRDPQVGSRSQRSGSRDRCGGGADEHSVDVDDVQLPHGSGFFRNEVDLCGPRRTGPVVQLHRRARAYREAATRQRNEVVIGPVMSLLLSLARASPAALSRIRVYFSSVVRELGTKRIIFSAKQVDLSSALRDRGSGARLRCGHASTMFTPPDMALGDCRLTISGPRPMRLSRWPARQSWPPEIA